MQQLEMCRSTSLISEQRRARRFKVLLSVVLGAAGAHYCAVAGDLSETGLLLTMMKALPGGTPVRVVFGQPPRLPRLGVEGVVRWSKSGQGVGVEFKSLSPEHRNTLLEFLDSRLD